MAVVVSNSRFSPIGKFRVFCGLTLRRWRRQPVAQTGLWNLMVQCDFKGNPCGTFLFSVSQVASAAARTVGASQPAASLRARCSTEKLKSPTPTLDSIMIWVSSKGSSFYKWFHERISAPPTNWDVDLWACPAWMLGIRGRLKVRSCSWTVCSLPYKTQDLRFSPAEQKSCSDMLN